MAGFFLYVITNFLFLWKNGISWPVDYYQVIKKDPVLWKQTIKEPRRKGKARHGIALLTRTQWDQEGKRKFIGLNEEIDTHKWITQQIMIKKHSKISLITQCHT